MTDVDACALPHPRLPLAELPPDVAEQAKAGGVTSFLGQFGHAPGLIEGWMAWYRLADDFSSFEPEVQAALGMSQS